MDHILELIKLEMKPSLGCTEPVAVGLAVSNTCSYLSGDAERVSLKISSNIFKNAFCVKIPGTVKAGIPLAAALGCLLCKPANTMEMFSGVTAPLVERAEAMLARGFIRLEVLPDSRFYIEVTAARGDETVTTVTADSHDHLVRVVRNGEVLLDKTKPEYFAEEVGFDVTKLSLHEIFEICQAAAPDDILFLREAVEMNLAVSREGLQNQYGMGVGRSIAKMLDEGVLQRDLLNHARVTVAAACDCRMGGGGLSAMTVLGSGNQGFEATLPVIACAQYLKTDEEKMLRALMLSILTTIFIKYQVGRLSPICGATLSGAAASCAITWLLGGNENQMAGAIQNMLGNLAGMICDGAKDGCALKLCNCAGEAVMSALLALNSSVIQETDGIVSQQAEETIKNVARLSTEGMSQVDMNVITIMMDKDKLYHSLT